MAGRNGSGVFTVTNADFVSGTTISSSEMDANFSDVATGLTQSIAADGQTTITGNLPMNSKKLTGLAAGSSAGDSVRYEQLDITTGVKGADLASNEPLVVGTDGNYFDVTGTATIATHTVAVSRHYFTQFDGILTLTHHATTQDLPGGANITTAAGDIAEWQSTGANTVQCVGYTKADGTAVAVAAIANNALTNAVQTFSKTQSGSITALSSSSNSIAVDLALNNHYSHTFTEATTLANPTNIVAGTSGSFFFTQHASSPKTLAFGSYYDFAGGTAPTVTATNSARDRIDYIVRSSTLIECVWTGAMA